MSATAAQFTWAFLGGNGLLCAAVIAWLWRRNDQLENENAELVEQLARAGVRPAQVIPLRRTPGERR